MSVSIGQEMPPEGGFSSVQYKRHIPKRGPPGWFLLVGMTSVIFGGLALVMQGRQIYM